jgi:hypothetical protein
VKYVKFTGNFCDLIPLGFTFQKLYASNYRCYHTNFLKEENTLWIWQKGREVCINDWHEFTVPILEYLKGKKFLFRTVKLNKGSFYTDIISFKCHLKSDIIELKTDKNSESSFMWQKIDGKINDREWRRLYKEYFNKYRNITVSPSLLRESLKRIEGMYKIVEDIRW